MRIGQLIPQLIKILQAKDLEGRCSLLWRVDHYMFEQVQKERVSFRKDILKLSFLYYRKAVRFNVVFFIHC